VDSKERRQFLVLTPGACRSDVRLLFRRPGSFPAVCWVWRVSVYLSTCRMSSLYPAHDGATAEGLARETLPSRFLGVFSSSAGVQRGARYQTELAAPRARSETGSVGRLCLCRREAVSGGPPGEQSELDGWMDGWMDGCRAIRCVKSLGVNQLNRSI
jgi:hypothetical protein